MSPPSSSVGAVTDDLLLRARGLTKRFGDFTAVDGIDVDVRRGEAFGFLGPNGAGKSTTINMLCTLAAPTAGAARVSGFDVVTRRDDVQLPTCVKLAFQRIQRPRISFEIN